MKIAPRAAAGITAALSIILEQVAIDIKKAGEERAWELFCYRNEQYIQACEAKEMFGIGPTPEDLYFRAALMIITVMFNTGEIEDATKMA